MKQVIFSPKAQKKLTLLLNYLAREFGEQVQQDFIAIIEQIVNRISRFPQSCPFSRKKAGIYKCVVTKNTTLYYRIRKTHIEVITLFDAREDQSEFYS